MSKHTKLYDKSPKMERDEDGDMKVKKADENKESGGGPGEDGSEADMANTQMPEMHDRHMKEMKDMHGRHEDEHKDMHKRHQKEAKKLAGDKEDKEGKE